MVEESIKNGKTDGVPASKRAPGKFFRNPAAMLGAAIVAVFALAALFAPILAPYPYDVQFKNMPAEKRAPTFACYGEDENFNFAEKKAAESTGRKPEYSGRHLFGLDSLYRDMLSRLLYGARVSLIVGILATLIALSIGTTVGAVAGYYGGFIDAALMRVTDMFMAFPSILLAVAISAMFDERSLAVVFIALGIVGWTTAARVVRGQVMTAKTNEYVLAARALGAGDFRILLVHVLPNCIAPVIVIGSIMVAGNILAEAGLSFLGVGVQPPEPSWGGMLRESMGMWDWPWMSIFPGGAIALCVLAFNLLGDGLRDALDPRMAG